MSSSNVQFAAKLAIFIAGMALAVLHDLTPQLAAVLSSALIALGVTNGAALVAQAGNLGAALSPPPKPAKLASVPPLATGMMMGALVASLVAVVACTPAQEAKAASDVRTVCAELAEADRVVQAAEAHSASVDAGKDGPDGH